MIVLLPLKGCRHFKARLTKTGIPDYSIVEFQGNSLCGKLNLLMNALWYYTDIIESSRLLNGPWNEIVLMKFKGEVNNSRQTYLLSHDRRLSNIGTLSQDLKRVTWTNPKRQYLTKWGTTLILQNCLARLWPDQLAVFDTPWYHLTHALPSTGW